MHGPIQNIEKKSWRFQISVARLIVASAFLGAGGGCLLAAFDAQRNWAVLPDWRRILVLLQFLASGPLIGAGLLAPTHQSRLGAYVGFFVGVVAGVVGVLTLVKWGAELPGVLWQLRYIIGFSFMAIVLAVVSVVQRVMANNKP
jgi:hypothetical protein